MCCTRIRAVLLAIAALQMTDISPVYAQGTSSNDAVEGATAVRRTCALGQIKIGGKCHRANRKICGDHLAQMASEGAVQTLREATARCGNDLLLNDKGICRPIASNEKKMLREKCADVRF